LQIKIVSKDYHLLGCDAMNLADILDEHIASIFRVTSGHTLGGVMTPATVGKVHHQTQQFSTDAKKQHHLKACFQTVTHIKLSHA